MVIGYVILIINNVNVIVNNFNPTDIIYYFFLLITYCILLCEINLYCVGLLGIASNF